MQSKTSFFKTVFIKNITRFWPLWALMSFIWVLAPLTILMAEDYMTEASGATYLYEGVTHVLPIFLLIYSCAVAMAVWSYMYSAKSVNLMHSLPATREGLFSANFTSGLVMVIIPIAIGGIFMMLVEMLRGGFSVLPFLLTIVAVLAESFFFFSLATFMAHLTGHILALPVLYFVLNFLSVSIEYIISVYASLLCYGLTDAYESNTSFLSPIVHILTNVNTVNMNEYPNTAFSPDLIYIRGWDVIGEYTLVGVVLTVVALLLYKKRKSESAGEVVSAKLLRPVALTCFTACAALTGGIVIYELLTITSSKCNPALLAFCMLISVFIGYYGGRMLIQRKLKVFKKKTVPGFLIAAALCIFFIAILRTDAFGREKIIPAKDKIEYVSVRIDSLEFIATSEDTELLDKVADLHRLCIGEKRNVQVSESVLSPYNYELTASSVKLVYTLKSGKIIGRHYSVPYKFSDINNPGTFGAKIKDFMGDRDVLLSSVGYNRKPKIVDVYIIDYYPNEFHEGFSGREAIDFYDALVEDIKAGSYNPYSYQLGRSDEKILNAILEFDGLYPYPYTTTAEIYITEKMKHTVAFLEEKGVKLGAEND